MTRPGFLLITLTACLLGLATAATAGTVQPATALATLLLACVAHAGANVLNDFHDALNGADAANDGAMSPFSGGSRLIQRGEVSVTDTARWAAWLLLPLVPAGLLLAWRGGTGLLAMEATARTYRYLDPAEVEERRQAKAKAAKEAKAAGGGK